MIEDWTGRTALVTGHVSGIGAATANWLEARGVTVVGCDVAQGQDVADPATWDRLAPHLAAIDLAVISAGISTAAPLTELSLYDWRRTLRVNLDGAMLSLQSALRAMIAHGRGGAIVVVASVTGLKAEPGTAAYGASKAGLIQLARVAAKEGAPHGIRVNAIAPGGVDTPIWDDMDFFRDMVRDLGSRDAAIAAMAAASPLRRFASADAIAAQIGFLLSRAADTITGTVLTADAGYSL